MLRVGSPSEIQILRHLPIPVHLADPLLPELPLLLGRE